MAALTIQSVDPVSGLTPTFASAASGGDTFLNDGKTTCIVKNGSGSSITLTVTTQQSFADVQGVGRVSLANLTFSIGIGAEFLLPFLSKSRFNDSSGLVHLGYSSATSVTVAAIDMQAPQ